MASAEQRTLAGLALQRSGHGPAVVLVHGLGGTRHVWAPQAHSLEARFSVVRFDLRGSGESVAREALSIDGWVRDLEAVIDTLGAAPVRLVGHSLGTLVAQHYTARHPQRVARLALLGVNRAPEDARRQTVRDRAQKVRADGMGAIVDSVIASALSAHTREQSPGVVDTVRGLLAGQDPEGYARSCEAVAASSGADLARITCPVLLVAGRDDTVSPPAASQKMADELADARVIVLERCGHWMTLERPLEVTQALLEFL